MNVTPPKNGQRKIITRAAVVVFGFGLLTNLASNYLNRRDKLVQEVARAGEPSDAAPLKTSQYKNIIIAALVAFSFGQLTNVVSNYLNRRDQHVQEADTCTSVVASLLTTTSFVQEVVQAAAASVAAPPPSNKMSNKFSLPPLDEILHSQDAALTILDAPSRDSVLRVEAYYRSLRDDLANTPGNYHTGETFGVPPTSGNQEAYRGLFSILVKLSNEAQRSLSTSAHCKRLAGTSFFWQSMRKGD